MTHTPALPARKPVRRYGKLRQVHLRADGVRVIHFRYREWSHPAIQLLPLGTQLAAVASGKHAVALYAERYTSSSTATLRPVCIATPAPEMKRVDPAQTKLAA
jgi:hypothetical protein